MANYEEQVRHDMEAAEKEKQIAIDGAAFSIGHQLKRLSKDSRKKSARAATGRKQHQSERFPPVVPDTGKHKK